MNNNVRIVFQIGPASLLDYPRLSVKLKGVICMMMLASPQVSIYGVYPAATGKEMRDGTVGRWRKALSVATGMRVS